MGIKNNKSFWGWLILILFVTVVFLAEKRRKAAKLNRDKNLTQAIGVTVGCNKNVRSSLNTLNYRFKYKEKIYKGTAKFDKWKRGDICYNVKFLVIFDSLDPSNSKLILDSSLGNLSEREAAE